jgi:hypothetical protein
MLENPDYPTVSRVMRVRPLPNEKPASGFSWGDYEDVHAGEHAGGGNEADGEDDGWGVVKGRSRSRMNITPFRRIWYSSYSMQEQTVQFPRKHLLRRHLRL